MGTKRISGGIRGCGVFFTTITHGRTDRGFEDVQEGGGLLCIVSGWSYHASSRLVSSQLRQFGVCYPLLRSSHVRCYNKCTVHLPPVHVALRSRPRKLGPYEKVVEFLSEALSPRWREAQRCG